MSPRAIALVLLAAASGCTTLADVSAGQVGCPPAAITVSDENRTFGGTTWTAECNGQQYYCSAHGGGEGSTAQVSCAPAGGTNVPGGAGAAATPAPAAGGCEYDTHCKGERVCSNGACVDPAPPAAAPESTPTPTPTPPPAEAPAAPPA